MRLVQLSLLLVAALASGCASLPLRRSYTGPPTRPLELETYYSQGAGYRSFREEIIREEKRFTLKQITIETDAGSIVLDYYQRRVPSDSLIFVFPVLGGKKNLVENYFAETYANRGFDTAIVQRHDDFKKPDGFQNIEELFKNTVIRDRIAMDFFEQQYKKKEFGSFGISRGAINVAITAGVDRRLKYNVMAMGGTDLVGVFRDSNERRINLYKKAVMAKEQLTEEQFYDYLELRLRTDPKLLAKYMDARTTLLFLALFDSSVPFKYGQRLREDLGGPEVIYLLAGHRSSVLFTELPNHVKPLKNFPILPFDYIETEAMAFYDRAFKTGRRSPKEAIFSVLQSPFTLIAHILDAFGKGRGGTESNAVVLEKLE